MTITAPNIIGEHDRTDASASHCRKRRVRPILGAEFSGSSYPPTARWQKRSALAGMSPGRMTQGYGNSDILWHNDKGSVAMWQTNGSQITLNQAVGTVDASWHFASR
jgi:hypothetical protein